jgi:hypothetical protein
MKFSKGDAAFTAAILAGIGILSSLLFLHTRAQSTGTGQVIGKVFFKREIAMRKFSDRMVWEDVENGSPLFSHDSVMTGNLSDAELVLTSGLKLKLEANTLVELDLEGEALNLRLSGGGLQTSGGNGGKTLITTKSGSEVNVTNATASVRSLGPGVAVEVSAGTVEVQGKDGKTETVSQNESFAAGKKTRINLQIAAPADGAIYLSGKPTAAVSLQCLPAAENPRAEISRSSDFSQSRKVPLAAGTGTAAITEGDWFLRCAGSASSYSPTRRFRVVNSGSYKIFRPAATEVSSTTKTTLRLEYQMPQGVVQNQIEIADNERFNNPVYSQKSSLTRVAVEIVKPGKYFYRLTPTDETGKVVMQISPFASNVLISKIQSRTTTAFTTVVPPSFNRVQVESGQAIIGFEGSGLHAIEISKVGDSAPFARFDAQPGIIKIPAITGPGKYTIRAKPREGSAASLAFTVRDKVKVEVITPKDGTVTYLYPDETTTAIALTWRGAAEVSMYQLVLAEDAGFKKILKKINVDGTDFRFTGLTSRKYYFKVLALENGIPRVESQAVAFAVEGKLQPVAGLYPREQQKVDITKTAGIPFKWQSVSGATGYEVKIYQKRKGKLILLENRQTKSPSMVMGNFKKFSEGEIIWEVRAQRANTSGQVLQRSEPVRGHMRLSFGPPPPPPEIVPTLSE